MRFLPGLKNIMGGGGSDPMEMLERAHQYSLENERKARDLFNQAQPMYDEAGNIVGRTPQYVNQYLSPYLGLNRYAEENPEDTLSRLGESYKQSPGYKYNLEEATRAANNAAAAGGYSGTPTHQVQLAKALSGIASQDYNNYLNNALGLHGMQQQMGYGANTLATNTLSDMLKNQALFQTQKAQGLQALGSGIFGQTAPQMQNAQLMANLADTERANRMTGIGNVLGTFGDMFGGGNSSNNINANNTNNSGFNFGNAAKGAAAGSVFGPIGMIGGGILGGFGGK